MPKKTILFFAMIIFPLLIGLACRFTSSPDPTATPRPVAEIEEVVVEVPTPTPTAEPIIEEPTEEPTPPAIGAVEGLDMLEKSLWMQDGPFVFVAFLFENSTNDALYQDVDFTISLFDQNGDLIDEDYHIMPWIFPNQTVGIVSNFWLPMDIILVDRVEVDWDYSGIASPAEIVNPFTTDSVVYWPDDGYSMITGKIVNNDSITYTDIRVNLICYDSVGEIIGGGYTYVEFIHLNDFMGFTSYVDTYGEIASVEAYPMLTYGSELIDKTDFSSEISILESGFFEDDFGFIVGGFVIRNETDSVLGNSLFYVTFYDENELITATAIDYIDILLPGESLGITPWVSTPPRGVVSSRFDILVLPGDPEDNFELTVNPFIVNSATVLVEDDNYVRVNFSNNYSKLVTEVDVFVLVYNAEGDIIGGGRDWTRDPVPAGGTTEIDVWVTYADGETIAFIDAWVIPSYWTNFE